MEERIEKIKTEYQNRIQQAQTLKELDEVFLALFGKTGEITLLPKDFSSLSVEDKKIVGPLFNQVKIELEKAIEERRNEVREESYKKLETEKFSLQLPKLQAKERKGHLHPLTQLLQETIEAFEKLGFQQFDAPHIDSDYYNFEVLNIPEGHPARNLWDTFYLDPYNLGSQPGRMLLRTHTSNSQIRAMKQLGTPLRIMSIGRCFRYEAVDARHEHTLDQFEIVYVDKKVNMANLQYLSEYFLKTILGKDIKARMRPKYYPFVEPGAGVDGLCLFCKGKGCRVCGGAGWLELAGAGMIHPTVLKNGGIDPNEYSGIAWGFGPLRVAMLKYGIEDVRSFLSGDLRFLEKF
ncbi:phenylalanine--tRNA ligase subunit alpha [Candidatus Daviesbacteria bacterium RIFCSPLOWO2_02_FULL_41_8]|uniref:Phenylalanine--tRNA ligase alpha subunit n=3 Tax=Candidatus Daviesiibacteriota TaxID=1752718 RepID=A0A1F5NHC4_9BACT|nr:MAG: phenylalanine--tRNA ligase subunit alpha [Candidatus Daviesbacteria bacterium RIFCSPHIGHO2_01_FULL_41_23]OGE32662.1 MAG: phenylalanine--tRNA ligase subunit alpha [Candidatus Daviesbacteria bacterium RIFCSPHIGHO2_02_FULL_41_10]OGE62515.1 MAG: phenylalanine--tRNA ligase subunit alpha [Candidatus Daviesbacteria bacterium RIFCSPLOWO2_01_FULL_41_32]OGE77111.1 MAG: phenylalanine--tRNA ligase subunit alpha [Candidatus Daviesbacteria bacterium RIFCSPLOWO2_02_FULL_41_8]